MKITFEGKSKMIGEVTYWAPPLWKVWKWKLRRSIIADAKYAATELAAGREPYPDIWDDPVSADDVPWAKINKESK